MWQCPGSFHCHDDVKNAQSLWSTWTNELRVYVFQKTQPLEMWRRACVFQKTQSSKTQNRHTCLRKHGLQKCNLGYTFSENAIFKVKISTTPPRTPALCRLAGPRPQPNIYPPAPCRVPQPRSGPNTYFPVLRRALPNPAMIPIFR